GSRATGDLFRVNLITGDGTLFSKGPGTPSLGMKVDLRGRLFVAGGTGGRGRVADAFTGRVLARIPVAPGPRSVARPIPSPDAAWSADSLRPVLYKVPLGRHGQLPDQSAVQTVPLTGTYVQVPGFNANGIARTPDGRALLIVQTASGLVFRVDPDTGVAST